jgi:hypothetical protein
MKVFALILCTVLSIQSCTPFNFFGVKRNGEIVAKEITVTDFSEIKLSAPADVIYEQKPDAAPYLRVETDENVVDLLNISVKNDELVVGIKERKSISFSKYLIYTNSKQLSDIQVSGSGDVVVNQLRCGKLNASVAGSGNINLEGKADNTVLSVTGSGEIKYVGNPAAISSSITGSGKIENIK